MKKLLLILTVVFVSVTSVFAGLNPYAYGLKSYLNDDKSELTMIYTLNANAETSQVYIFEKEKGNIVKTLTNGKITQGTCTLTVATADLPKDVPLSWKVVVNGNANQTQPAVVYDRVSNNRPNATHGVAIDKNPESPNFGNIYYTEASSGNLNTTWDWMEKYTRPCVWQYSPQLTYLGHFYKDKENNVDVANFVTTSQVEPHRVRISDDNRIFVSSCYADATTAVWEYKGNNNFNRVIARTSSYGKVLSMDVFGSGNNLKILLCYMSGSKLTFREYALGSAGSISGAGTDKGTYTDGTLVVSGSRVGVAYDDNGESFWFAVDRSFGYSSRVFHMTKSGSVYTCSDPFKCPLYTGGDGLFVKGNLLVKGVATSDGSNAEGRLYFYTINNDGSLTQKWTDLHIWSSYWVNDIDMDYAGNLYIASAYAGNAIAISMPYDGSRTTEARDIYTFTLAKPVPNILATDLCVTPHDKQAKYIFSFNVNTKPEGAEIRFYTSEQDMLNDSKQNATYSDYDNHDNCSYYYRFSELKQGRMSVELDILGHEGGKELTDKKLPSGKLYWNVFLKTRRSLAFSPIYVQPLDGEDLHYRLHVTVNNYPETDGFGHIYSIDYKRDKGNTNNTTDEGMDQNPCKLMIYTIGDENIDDNDQDELKSDSRYTLVKSLTTEEMVQPRRPAVAPDGMVYLTDYGDYDNVNQTYTNGPASFVHGGIWIFNPNDPLKSQSATEAKLGRFYDDSETASDVCFYGIGTSLKLFKTNTYEEINHHGADYSNSNWANNGCRIYSVGNADNTIRHKSDNCTDNNKAGLIKFLGDANGNMSIRATNDGIWVCQHRSGTVTASYKPDDAQATALMFYNNNGERKFQSYNYDGGNLSQTTTSIMQSTPGAGMTISPDEKYLYVVNHEGNILEFGIGGNATNGKTLTLENKFINKTDYKCISSMNFDYAGNLVVTTDQSYPANASEKTQIVVFTMPYNRDNARSIPASKAQREIPERLSYAEDKENTLATIAKTPTLVDLFRPMPNTSYSTICLPFALDISTLEDGHPYKTADIRAFEGAELSNAVGGEKILYLNFSADPVTSLSANTPYIIQPSVRIPNLVQLPATWGTNAAPSGSYAFGDNNSITFTGVIPKQDIVVQEGKTLLLVAENRLAEMAPDKTVDGQPVGEILGFRGYFTLGEPLPKGMQAVLRNKDNTVTGLVDINGKKVNINKYLREGRVYIRVGDSLYTVDGQLVK